MSLTKRVVNRIKKPLQQACGWLRELDTAELIPQERLSAEDPCWYRWTPTSAFRMGWYMLEIRGTRATLGHDLRLRLPDATLLHLQIGAKNITKRIVYLPMSCVSLDLAIVPDLAEGPAPRDCFAVALSRLSSRYANSRMQRKLATSNGMLGRRYSTADNAPMPDSSDLYADYNRLMQRHVNRVEYAEWLANAPNEPSVVPLPSYTQGNQPQRITPGRRPSDIRLVFAITGGAQVRDSVQRQFDGQSGQSALTRILSDNEEVFSPNARQSLHTSSEYTVLVGEGVVINPGIEKVLRNALAEQPEAELFYSDHDVALPDGRRGCPAFKPAWNAELLLSGNYVGNFIVVKSSFYQRIGGLNPAFGDSMFYDFLLRAIPVLADHQVVRIPRMLFSRLQSEWQDKTGMTVGEQDRAALAAHLKRNRLPAMIKPGLLKSLFRVDWSLPAVEPMVDIIIPTRDRVDLLRCCVDSLLSTTHYRNFRVTVVDNGSTEPATHRYYEELANEPRFNLVHYPGEFNYSAINNFAVGQTSGDIVVLLNNDTEIIDSDWLGQLVAQAVRPEIGCVGAKLYYSSGLIQHAGVILGIRGVAGHAHRFYPGDADGHCARLKVAQNVSAVTAACLAVRRSVFEQVGGLDEVNLKVAYNDVDFCLRVLEAGYKNIWTPHVELFHHESVSRGSDDTLKKSRRFQREYDYMIERWHTNTISDPSYNPNLALDQEDFWLAA